jgi:leucyl-tRNA synthetase
MNTWGPVDLYMGGAEHTVLHLLYARFFTKVLYDEGYLTFDEPFLKLRHQGIILGPDHRKMSKRWGNVINPLDVCNEYGADTLRMYEMFMGPIDAMKPWNVKSVQGPYRFLTRVWKLYKSLELRVENRGTAVRARTDKTKDVKQDGNLNKELQSKLHKTIKKVTDDIPELKFNTAIAAMMEFVNEWEKAETRVENSEFGITDEDAKMFLQILAPFAPFMTEEIWREGYGEKHSIHLSPWPKYDTSLIVEETINLPVQVNGKMRGTLVISQKEAEDQDTVVKKAREDEKIAKFITGNPRKIIYVTGRILNIVAS